MGRDADGKHAGERSAAGKSLDLAGRGQPGEGPDLDIGTPQFLGGGLAGAFDDFDGAGGAAVFVSPQPDLRGTVLGGVQDFHIVFRRRNVFFQRNKMCHGC